MATAPRDVPAGAHPEGPDAGYGDDPTFGTPSVREAVASRVADVVEVGHEDHHGEHEKPEDWGWHADLGGMARIGGWVSLIALALMITATQYNRAGTVALVLCMIAVAGGLIWERQRRKNSWRR